ncbi:radical SAM protein [Thermodesulfobacteriota bacterium]
MKQKINHIEIEDGSQDYQLTSDILKRLGDIPFTAEEEEAGKDQLQGTSFDLHKDRVRLLPFKGEFLKPCPGTKSYICCGYLILNTGTNCPLDCSYCILQAYFNKPSLRIFVNLEDELGNIGRIIDSSPERIFRIGTGEFTDSFALDRITGFSTLLSEFIASKKNSVLELKTKTTEIDRIFGLGHRDRIVISWSLNSPYIVSHEEHLAPSVEQRLKAAKKCQEEGFVTGFHFDPLIIHKNWKGNYRKVLDLMDKYLDPEKIIWISMGCIRFVPALKPIIRKRHPKTTVLDAEFIQGLDGKMRYLKPVRIDMYYYIRGLIEGWAGYNPGIYLCMESDEIWRKSLKWSPGNSPGLSDYLDNRVKSFW